ncbi:hypothetical protein [Halogeometricum sp. CBA1124]|uniref:hypothetical protein n=1 Tax=Halogeometricum sp. CBA1124 TaxID=2668071 RepID=UPI001E4072A1|nr:hypothetical protein [Halogeometricum sp. CBA1124]
MGCTLWASVPQGCSKLIPLLIVLTQDAPRERSLPRLRASVYLSIPGGNRFVTTESGEGDDDRDDLTEETVTCDDCGTAFPALHGPARD